MSDGGVYLGFHSGGMHDNQSDTAPAAFDHIDQLAPPNLPTRTHDGITQNPRTAVATTRRSANRMLVATIGLAADGTPVKLVDSQKGRLGVILHNLAGNPAVQIANTPDQIAGGLAQGFTVQPNDPPLTIFTEDTIWAAIATPGATAASIQIIVLNVVPDEAFG